MKWWITIFMIVGLIFASGCQGREVKPLVSTSEPSADVLQENEPSSAEVVQEDEPETKPAQNLKEDQPTEQQSKPQEDVENAANISGEKTEVIGTKDVPLDDEQKEALLMEIDQLLQKTAENVQDYDEIDEGLLDGGDL